MELIFQGKVQHGAKRGRLLGFPTANIALHKKISEGIYVSKVLVHNDKKNKTMESSAEWYPAATFIGSAKTFGEKEYKAESFLLDFDKNLYGKWITITLLKKIRENKKFLGEEALIKQMEKDIEEVRKYFTKGR